MLLILIQVHSLIIQNLLGTTKLVELSEIQYTQVV